MRIWSSRSAHALQFGLLATVGLALFGGIEPPAAAAPICLDEGMCAFKRPLFMIVVDYSTSMNAKISPTKTRWQAVVDAVVTMVDAQNGYLPSHAMLGLMRFGHDPNAAVMGTTIPGDTSGIVDGQTIDVRFYDEADPNKKYFACNGEAIKAAITSVPPPLGGDLVGIESWTKGALDRAKAYFAQTKADHPNETRRQAIMLLTDGEWTDPSGMVKMMPAEQNPAITAKDLWDNQTTPTHVVALGEAAGEPFADELAGNGGTGQATGAMTPHQLIVAAVKVVEELETEVIRPVCAPGLPRVMVLLDASSSMLNIMGGTMYGSMGTTGWDQARSALVGVDSLFDQVVDKEMQEVEGLAHLGLAVFGHNVPNPGEQKILVDYRPCMKDNFAWALDPESSCVAPGCIDPWGGPPITWTFQDGSVVDPPGFAEKTLSHMPRCDKGNQVPFPNACVGSGTYTHLGLQLVAANLAAYKQACQQPGAELACDAKTPFVNVLITDGIYNSTDAQVQGPLEQMFAAGVKTYVIGFGDLVNTQEAITKLGNMASWGSGGTETYFDADNQMQLQAALAAIVNELPYDACCGPLQCEGLEPPEGPCCGNGVVQGRCKGDPVPEECDDGNLLDGDGCSAFCKLEEAETSTGTTDATGTTGGSTTDGSTTIVETTDGEMTGGEATTAEPTTGTSGEVVTSGHVPTTSGADSTGDASGGPATTEASTPGDGCGCATDGRSRGAPALLPALLLLRRARRGGAPGAARTGAGGRRRGA